MNWNTAMVFAVLEDDRELSIEQIAERLSLSNKTVGRSIAELERCGYIKVRRRNGVRNSYEILKRPDLLASVQGWFYRFMPRELWRRLLIAIDAEDIYYKALHLRRARGSDEFNARRDELLRKYPNIAKLFAVWEPETTARIRMEIDELLEMLEDEQA